MSKIANKPARLWLVIATVTLVCLVGGPDRMRAVINPGQAGPCTALSQTVTINGSQSATVHYLSETTCGSGPSAPYPSIVFSHGFSMFGLSDGAADNAGNGEHLAGWGYVVAIAALDDDTETRIGQT
jgi:hypothetical protein